MKPPVDSTFSFAHPWVLWFLLLVPLLALLQGNRGSAPSVLFSSITTLRELGRLRKSRAGAILFGLLLGALACFFIALARPRKGQTMSNVQASGIDIILALDVSRSMLAEDFTIGKEPANRLAAVKQLTQKFIENRPNDRIGIIAFAGKPYLVSPLTLDHTWLFQNLERIRIGLVEDGTAIGSAIASAANRLKDKESKSKIIVLLTDGDNNAGKIMPNTAAEAAKALGIKVYTIGAGTRGYAPIPVQDMFGRTVYRNIKVEVDEATLKQIAATANGKFYRATDTKSLQDIFAQIDKLEKSTVELDQYTQFDDLFQWFAGAGVALLLAHSVLGLTWMRRVP